VSEHAVVRSQPHLPRWVAAGRICQVVHCCRRLGRLSFSSIFRSVNSLSDGELLLLLTDTRPHGLVGQLLRRGCQVLCFRPDDDRWRTYVARVR
jgi:hypothetical protein